jgi:hypothetical protein
VRWWIGKGWVLVSFFPATTGRVLDGERGKEATGRGEEGQIIRRREKGGRRERGGKGEKRREEEDVGEKRERHERKERRGKGGGKKNQKRGTDHATLPVPIMSESMSDSMGPRREPRTRFIALLAAGPRNSQTTSGRGMTTSPR